MDTVRAFDKAALSDGAISRKNMELIAVAVALTTQCDYCIEVPRRARLAAGTTEVELSEVVFVASAQLAGAGTIHESQIVADGSVESNNS